jgi:NADH-quinone oxidoreductase subunit N
MNSSNLMAQATDNLQSLVGVGPGVILAITCLIHICIKSLPNETYQQPIVRIVSISGLAIAFYLSIQLKASPPIQAGVFLWNYLLQINPWAIGWHQLLILLAATLLLLDQPNKAYSTPTHPLYETMIIGSLFGAYLLVMANHWLVVYMSLAITSTCSVVLIYPHARDQKSPIPSFNYVLYQALASSLMLWGIGYLYNTGSLFMHNPCPNTPMGFTGLCLSLTGILLQIGLFPFHFWIPNVYKQVPLKVVTYLATVPKLAALSVLAKIWKLYTTIDHPYSKTLQGLLALLASLTLLVGHFGALRQKHPKDIIIYGSIAQGGWLLASIIVGYTYAPMLSYYSYVYGIMTIAAWSGLQLLGLFLANPILEEYNGIGWKKPWVSIGLFVALLALMGLPPTAGFTAKFLVLIGLWAQAQATQNKLLEFLWLVSLLGSLLSMYYYLKIPYTLFFKATKQSSLGPVFSSYLTHFIFLLLLLLLIGIFFFNNKFINLLSVAFGL